MEFEDKTIVCADCGQDFVHSADDQRRYAERGFTNEPKRCRECREKRRADSPAGGPRGNAPAREAAGESRGGGMGGGPRRFPSRGGGGGGFGRGPREGRSEGPRESFQVVCAECGQTTTVPFKPAGNRPVYCRDCYRAKKPPR